MFTQIFDEFEAPTGMSEIQKLVLTMLFLMEASKAEENNLENQMRPVMEDADEVANAELPEGELVERLQNERPSEFADMRAAYLKESHTAKEPAIIPMPRPAAKEIVIEAEPTPAPVVNFAPRMASTQPKGNVVQLSAASGRRFAMPRAGHSYASLKMGGLVGHTARRMPRRMPTRMRRGLRLAA